MSPNTRPPSPRSVHPQGERKSYRQRDKPERRGYPAGVRSQPESRLGMKQIVQSARSGKLKLTEVPAPQARPGHLLVATRASLISAGTERMVVDFAPKSPPRNPRSPPHPAPHPPPTPRPPAIPPT